MSDQPAGLKWEFRSLSEKETAVDAIEAVMKEEMIRRGLPELIADLSFGLRIALEEVLVNHLKHGHQFDEGKVASVQLLIENNTLVVESEDEGEGYLLSEVPDPTDPENLELPCGRGVLIINGFTAKWHGKMEVLGRGNRTRMTFLLAEPMSDE